MRDLEKHLHDRITEIFSPWDDAGIYAVSFFIDANSANCCRGLSNLTSLSVSYNTEDDCGHAPADSERRWNYAYWRQNETSVFCCQTDPEGYDLLLDWYEQQGLENIGGNSSDPNGPVGFSQLAEVLGRVARRFYDEGYFVKKLGHPVPILIHDLEYACPCTAEATAYANPNGEAADFLAGDWEDYWPEDDEDDEHQDYLRRLSAANDELINLFSQTKPTAGRLNDLLPDMERIMKDFKL